MSDYLDNLLVRAKSGLEIAGSDMRADINIDCYNLVKILTERKEQQAQITRFKDAFDEVCWDIRNHSPNYVHPLELELKETK